MDLLKKYSLLQYLFLFLIIFNFFLILQIEPVFYDPDGFYHLKMAELIKEHGLIFKFPWQQFTVLKEYFTDQHLLYHLLLIPFIYLFGSLIGIKIAHSFFNALLFLLIFYFLKQFKINFPWLILILLAVPAFVYRLNLIKATPLALIILLLAFYCLIKKKYWSLALFSFLYVWTHGGFIIILLITILYSLIFLIKNKKICLLSNIAVVSGLISGLIINPYFPKNLKFYWHQLVQIGLINYHDKLTVGAEWYPYNFFNLVPVNGFIFICFILALAVFIVYRKQQPALNYFLLAISLLFLGATFKSRRYIEYFVPFAFIWSMFCSQVYWKTKHFTKFKKLLFKKKMHLSFIGYLMVTYLAVFTISFQMAANDAKNPEAQYTYYQAVGQFLKNNSQPGEIVFHTRWHRWPQLFYHNTHNYYLVGLDPTFMYNYNPQLYYLWKDISEGKLKQRSSQSIKKIFQSQYILLGAAEKDKLLLAYLKRDSKAKLIYQDDQAYLFQIY